MKKIILTVGLVAFIGLAGFAQRDAQTREGGSVGVTPIEKTTPIEKGETKSSSCEGKEKAACSKSCEKSCSDKKALNSTDRAQTPQTKEMSEREKAAAAERKAPSTGASAPATRETAAPAKRDVAPAQRTAPSTGSTAPATRQQTQTRTRE